MTLIYELNRYVKRKKYAVTQITASIHLHEQMLNYSDKIDNAVVLINSALYAGGKIILFGNGGSAADAQHLAAEFIGTGQPAITLTADSAVVTALANDFGYSSIFTRQIQPLIKKEDIIIGFTTSGRSENVVTALRYTKNQQCRTIAFVGDDAPGLLGYTDVLFTVQSTNTQRIQEMHKIIGHLIWEICNLKD